MKGKYGKPENLHWMIIQTKLESWKKFEQLIFSDKIDSDCKRNYVLEWLPN